MAWVYLVLAGLFEIGWASSIKFVDGFTRPWPTLIFVFCLAASLFLLARAARELPIGTAYAVWTGIGAAGTVLVGILVYKEPATALRMLCLTALIASIIGLRFATPT
jgi:quaternary ammonium compound-resistance protein SugE